jgi:hypothetical protein
MSETIKGAIAFLVGCVGVAVVTFALLGGIALVVHNGQAQVCAASGGHWNATDKPIGVVGDSGAVERTRECVR